MISVLELDVLRLLSQRPCHHSLIPLPQRLRMGPLLAAGYIRLEIPDFWSLTADGEAVLASESVRH